MIPTIGGKPHHFVVTGLYDALFVMRDLETSTLWNHITGEAVHGPLLGRKLPLSNLLQMNVKQALAMDPNMEVAISSRPFSGGGNRLDPNATLAERFIGSLDLKAEDTRRPRMELGLGLSSGEKHRFYPMDLIQQRGGAFFDVFDNRSVLIYIDQETFTPAALFVDAKNAKVQGNEIRLNDGRALRSGILVSRDGQPLPMDRPLQTFTRWYGFALTFPGCEVFGQ
jgi:hypothetical protein